MGGGPPPLLPSFFLVIVAESCSTAKEALTISHVVFDQCFSSLSSSDRKVSHARKRSLSFSSKVGQPGLEIGKRAPVVQENLLHLFFFPFVKVRAGLPLFFPFVAEIGGR